MDKSKVQTEHLTVEQVAEMLNIHPRTVYQLVRRGNRARQRWAPCVPLSCRRGKASG
jgi:transposase